MARSKRPVLKVVLVMAVLATAGAGVYHFSTNGGWPSLAAWGSAPTTRLEADPFAASSAVEPSANLDAVASAWAGTPAKETHSYAASSASGLVGQSSTIHDPHVIPTSYGAKPATASHSPAVGDAPRSATALDDDRYALSQPLPSALNTADREGPVARGQDADDDSPQSDAHAAEPNPLRSSTPGLSDSARRAREAFATEEEPSSSERYNAALTDGNSFRSNAAEASHQVNPFASQPAPLPPAIKSADPIQSSRIPALSDGENRLSRIPETGASVPSGIGTSTSPTPYGGGSSSYAGGLHSPSANRLTGIGSNLGSGAGESYGSEQEGTGRPGDRALEGPQQPSLVIQKFAPPEIQVGKPAKFIVQVQNVGRRSADDVVIHDELPNGTKLVSTSPRADVDGSHLTWDLGTLSAGEQRAVEVQLMPTEEGDIGSVATVSFATPASVKTHCTMPQLAIRMTAPSQVMIGEDEHVKIELRNPGSGDATGVMLFENVPEQVRHAAGPSLEFEVGTLRAGETREMDLVLTAQKAGKVANTLTARADGNLQVQQEVDFEVIAPELQLAVDGPSRRYLERPATYQVTIANPGTAAAKDIEIVTKLPKGMKFIRANNMGEYDAATHAIYWSLAELPEGEKGTVELVAMPIESGQHTLEVEGHAQRGLSDQTKQEILVEGLAAIMFEVKDLQDPIEVGGETTYEIRVVNQGSKAATNVQVAVNIPPGMQVVSADGETQHTVESGGVLFEPLAQLAPKAESVFRVQVQGIRPGDQRVTVEVNTDDISQPIRKEESTRVFGDE
jgi:uncharacterized repeat protein (TIGR01451 family)